MADNGYSYLMNNLIGLDQQLNSLLGGSCDETLSSRAYRMARLSEERNDFPSLWCDFEQLVDWLFWFDKGPKGEGHCQLANMVELAGGHMPKAMARQLLVR